MNKKILKLMWACVMLALLGASCEKPPNETFPVQTYPRRPGAEQPAKPHVERWLLLAKYSDRLCGYSFNFTLNDSGQHKDLYDTLLSCTYVNWTNSTYFSHSGISSVTGIMYYPRSGKIFYTDNENNHTVFPAIQFEQGFSADQGLSRDTKWEINYYGNYTSDPYRKFDFTTAFTRLYNIPNQFVVLRTDQYLDGYYNPHELILYFAVFNYDYWPF